MMDDNVAVELNGAAVFAVGGAVGVALDDGAMDHAAWRSVHSVVRLSVDHVLDDAIHRATGDAVRGTTSETVAR